MVRKERSSFQAGRTRAPCERLSATGRCPMGGAPLTDEEKVALVQTRGWRAMMKGCNGSSRSKMCSKDGTSTDRSFVLCVSWYTSFKLSLRDLVIMARPVGGS